MRRYGFLSLVVIFFAGCAPPGGVKDDWPYFRIPPGSVIHLHETITIPAERARVFVQQGRVNPGVINEGLPWCYFRVRDPVPVDHKEGPGRYTVVRTRRDRRDIASTTPVQVAASGGGLESPQTLAWVMDVRPELPSEVIRIVCGGAFDDPARAKTPSLRQIRLALGSIASLKLP